MEHDRRNAGRRASDRSEAWRNLSDLTDAAMTLCHDLVAINGVLADIDQRRSVQLGLLRGVRSAADQLEATTQQVSGSTERGMVTADEAQQHVRQSIEILSRSGQSSRLLAEWVQSVRAGSDDVDDMIVAVGRSNTEIADIASQVNILAMNAKIEAARAGQAGMGFAIVAEAINELSHKTKRAAEDVSETVNRMSDWMHALREGAVTTSETASQLLSGSEETDAALTRIEGHVAGLKQAMQEIGGEMRNTDNAVARLAPSITSMVSSISDVADAVRAARSSSSGLVDVSEGIMQTSVALGGHGRDGPKISRVRELATQIATAFEQAIDSGRIGFDALFDRGYRPIRGTDPQQVMAAFTEIADQILPPLLDPVLDDLPEAVYCVAADSNGYVPTHNRPFSHRQSADKAWNVVHCRNRRIFDDRVGLKAARNTQPFLMQTYRRDMGGGEFAMMRDLSAPIHVHGRHWGALRLGYRT